MSEPAGETARARIRIGLPAPSLVVLVGVSGSGKSTFAARHFAPTEVISSDRCRGIVGDDETDQEVTAEAFELLHSIARLRLRLGRFTVIDATNIRPEDRKPLVAIAREHDLFAAAIVLSLPVDECVERNKGRDDRPSGVQFVRRQHQLLRRSLRGLKKEGFRSVTQLRSAEDAASVEVVRTKLWNDRREEQPPFDIIGDVHGCADELEELLGALGYVAAPHAEEHPLAAPVLWRHPGGRRAIFLGDLVDRGPRILDSVRIASTMVRAGSAFCVPGNHETKLFRKLIGKDVQITHGLERTLAEIEALPAETRERTESALREFIDSLVSHYVLDRGRLVVAHAGMKERYQGRSSGRVREFALYGETTGETDEFGLPVRYDWAAEYRGSATVVYGHTPVPEPQWLNHTINIDTGCVYGGALTALRFPETELVSVPARATYAESRRPFLAAEERAPLDLQQEHDRVLHFEDVDGKRQVQTRLRGRVAIRAENAAAALEVMSRFAVDPRWLIHLPPTMSPSEATTAPGLLEHPQEAFAHYRAQGIPRVIAEEKHMGSRALLVVGRDEEALRERFGVEEPGAGVIVTRTGRPFFPDRTREQALLERVRRACDRGGLWEALDSPWLLLDAEVMPWSEKARSLIRGQYAATGAAAEVALDALLPHAERLAERIPEGAELRDRLRRRRAKVGDYRTAYRHYCWPVESLDDLRIAPFHLLAAERAVFDDKDHRWHLEMLRRLVHDGEPILITTAHREVDLSDPESERAATEWWSELTGRGGEGFVVKPFEYLARGRRGLVQPALKCRGPEYLRIIYGPEYDDPGQLERLRVRGVAAKRSLALRELALGLEALHRFVRREPLRRVHECVFGVLALESEPVDPRL